MEQLCCQPDKCEALSRKARPFIGAVCSRILIVCKVNLAVTQHTYTTEETPSHLKLLLQPDPNRLAGLFDGESLSRVSTYNARDQNWCC